MTDELVALIDGEDVGRVTHGKDAQLSFTYNDRWRRGDDAYPISLSLPLAVAEHGHEPVHAFLSGLLPDNDRILDAWGRSFGVSARNPFRLLAHVGEECAGAVQFVVPARVEKLRRESTGRVQWLSDADVAERLRLLRTDEAAWRVRADEGQFSLAGAQPKTAFLFRNGRWGVPSGRTPTTHILKPPSAEFDGFAENEHLCLELTRSLGIPACESRVMQFEDQVAIVITRYDRVQTDGLPTRVHQEDLCQALGLPPTRKYENEGGPGIAVVVNLLRENSRAPSEDVATFLDAVALCWIIAGTDGHAKNYSVLIGPRAGIRLAPLYDVASAAPYPRLSDHRIKLVMKIGGEYLVRRIGRRQWERLAQEVRVRPDGLLERVSRLAAEVPDRMNDVRKRAAAAGLRHPILSRLQDAVGTRARSCLDEIGP